jgi:hypothetical protein
MIRDCEQLGWETYWNCSATNLPSMRLARKLGYRTEKPYHLIAWLHAE